MRGEIADRHLDEGAVIRLLDGALTEPERRETERHLAACARCEQLARELRAASTAVSGALALVDDVAVPPVRQRERPTPVARRAPSVAWKIAAALLVATALALGGEPLWALARAFWAQVVSQDPAEHARAPAPGGATATPERILIRMAPYAPDLVLDFAARPTAGSLQVRAHDENTIVLAGSAASGAGVVVLPHALRVQTDSASVEDFSLIVPTTLRTITVTVEGRPVLTANTSELRGVRRVPLR